ncbi:DUF775-domain-containing protein [Martensiomyces pterosporus]|nr:DUF775-domain-containing protein [Martensiomyces pterosporus]
MFGCIVAGRLVQTNLRQVDVNKYVFELPDAHAINHIVVFLLGTVPFEPGYAATVHLQWPNKSWQLLGMLSNDKPSSIFRLKSTLSPDEAANMPGTSAELGISIEPVQAVEQAIMQLHHQQQQPGGGIGASAPNALFAERTLQGLFDYAMSFATRADASMGVLGSGASVQVLPVKAFEDWYNSFLRKLQRDPSLVHQ